MTGCIDPRIPATIDSFWQALLQEIRQSHWIHGRYVQPQQVGPEEGLDRRNSNLYLTTTRPAI